MEQACRPALAKSGLAGSKIITQWHHIAGSTLAARAVPIKVSFPKNKTTGGTLTIAVESGFALQMQHEVPLILEKLALYFGYKAIDHIKISHTLTRNTKAKAAVSKTTTIPRPKPHTINPALLESVEDEELKQALQSFATTLNETK